MEVTVRPELLRWARERSGYAMDTLTHRFPRLQDWERNTVHPTLKQLEKFAKAVHAPIGYLFLQKPPVEKLPIPDFRTIQNRHIDHPSPDLLDMVYVCQQRQEWYRDFAQSMGEKPLAFVGSIQRKASVEGTAAVMREALGFDIEERRQMPNWSEALRH